MAPMIPKLLSGPVGALFSTTVLGPIRLGSALQPHAIWPALERLSYRVAGGAARAVRPLLARRMDHPLRAAMRFVHLAEALVGIEGEWEVLDPQTAVRRVHRCPHARSLHHTTEFCTRLGAALGQGLAERLVDDPSVRFEVLGCLSQGNPCCEYRLTIKQ